MLRVKEKGEPRERVKEGEILEANHTDVWHSKAKGLEFGSVCLMVSNLEKLKFILYLKI